MEAFLFSTRLTRITRQLRLARPDDAVAAVAAVVPDWSGGTRIGGAVKGVQGLFGKARQACGAVLGKARQWARTRV